MLWMDSAKGLLQDPNTPLLSLPPAPPPSPPLLSDASRYLLSQFLILSSSLLCFQFQCFYLSLQVTTNTEARVGRFSVSRAQEQSPESRQSPSRAAQAANGTSDPGQVLTPDSTHKASLPSLNSNSFNNSYISSDNDSEFEDEDFKREVNHLREK